MKINVRKIVSVILGCTLLLSGCGKQDDKTNDLRQEPVELTLWYDGEDTYMDIVKQEVAKLEPEIQVKFYKKSNLVDIIDYLVGDSRNSPDLIWYPHDSIGFLASIGAIEPLDDYIDKSQFDKLLSATKEAGLFEGRHYLLPVYYESLVMLYNKDFVTNPPKTTDELLQLMKAAQQKDAYGMLYPYYAPYYAVQWLHAFDADFIDQQGKSTMNTPKMEKALTYMKGFKEYFPEEVDEDSMTKLFIEGKAYCITVGPWNIPAIEQAGINYGITEFPTVTETGKPLSPYLGVQGVMMSSSCDNKEAAVKVLNQLCNVELGEKIAKSVGGAPAVGEAYENQEVKDNAIILAEKKTEETGVPMPNCQEMSLVWGYAYQMLMNVYFTDSPITDIMKQMDDELKKEIEAFHADQDGGEA